MTPEFEKTIKTKRLPTFKTKGGNILFAVCSVFLVLYRIKKIIDFKALAW